MGKLILFLINRVSYAETKEKTKNFDPVWGLEY